MEQITLPTGDILKREDRAIVVELAGARRVLSTSLVPELKGSSNREAVEKLVDCFARFLIVCMTRI